MANEKKPEFERIDYGARRNAINDFLKAARDAKTYNKNGRFWKDESGDWQPVLPVENKPSAPIHSFYDVKDTQFKKDAAYKQFAVDMGRGLNIAANSFVKGAIAEMAHDPTNPSGEMINETYQNYKAITGLAGMVVSSVNMTTAQKQVEKLYSQSTREEITAKANECMQKYGLNTVYEADFTDVEGYKLPKGKTNDKAGTFYEKDPTNPAVKRERVQFTATNAANVVKEGKNAAIDAYTSMRNAELYEKTRANIENALQKAAASGIEIKDVTDKNIQMLLKTGKDNELKKLLGTSEDGMDIYRTLQKVQAKDIAKYNKDVHSFTKKIMKNNGLSKMAQKNKKFAEMLDRLDKNAVVNPKALASVTALKATMEAGQIFEDNVVKRTLAQNKYMKAQKTFNRSAFFVYDRVLDFLSQDNELVQQTRKVYRTVKFVGDMANRMVSVRDSLADGARAAIKANKKSREAAKNRKNLRIREKAQKMAELSTNDIRVKMYNFNNNLKKTTKETTKKVITATKNTVINIGTATATHINNSIPVKATKRAVGKAVSKITNIKENIAKDVTNLLLFAGRKIESNYVASKFISVSKWGIKKSQQVVNATKRKIAQEASKRALKKAKKEAAKAASGKVIKNGLGKVITEMGGAFISKLKWIILGIFALILCAVPIAVGVIGAISSLFLLILFAILIFFATILGFVTSLLSGILGIFGLDNAQVDAYAIEQMYQMEIDWYNDQWDLAAADAKANGYEMYQMVCLDPFTKEIILEDGDKLDASSFMVSNVRDIVSTFDVMQNYYATRYAGYSKEELQELKDSGQVTKDSIILSYEMDDWAKQMIKYTHHGLVAASDVGEGKLVNSYTRVQTTPSTIENNYKNNSLNNLHGYYEMYYSLDEFYHSGATTTYSRNSFFGEPIKIFNPNLGYGEDFAQIPYGCTAGIIYYVRDVYGNYVYEEKLDGEDNIIYPMTSRIVCAGHTIATYYITVDMLTDVDLGQENYDGTVTPNENTDISTLNMTSDFNHSLRLASLRKSALDYSYNNTFGSSNPETKENSEKIALLKLISNWRTRYGILMPRGGTTIPLGGPKAVYTGLSEFSPSVDRSKAVIFKEGYDRLYAEERDRYFKAAFNNEYFNDTMYIVDCSKNIHYQFSNLAFMIDRSSPSWYWDQVKEYYFQEGTDFTPGGITD